LIASSRTLRIALFAALVAALVVVPFALAGKGGNGGGGGGPKPKPGSGSGTLTLVVVSSPYNDGLPHWGGQVSFDVSTTSTTEPHVQLQCFQNGTLVYTQVTGYYASYPWPWTQTFTLSSGAWTGGAASCTATGYYLTGSGTSTFATLSFSAAA
jgi:hypothetical protein